MKKRNLDKNVGDRNKTPYLRSLKGYSWGESYHMHIY